MGSSKHTGVSKHMGVFKHKVAFKHTGGASKHMAASKHRGGIPTYRWYPSIWWHLNLWGHMDTPLVWQSMLSLCCLCTGGMQMYEGMWTPPLSDKVSFLCVVYVQGASKHHPNIWGHPNILVFPIKLTHTCQDWFPPFAQKKKPSLIHSDSTWWWQPSWILPGWIQTLPSWIQTPCYLLSDSLKNTLPPLWLWLKLIQSNLMMAAILNSAILDSAILHKTLTQTNSIWLKLIHSHSTWWWQPSWIQPFCTKNLTHSFWLNFMMAAILNSAMLDSDTLLSSLRFTQKHSHSTLTQTNSIWLKTYSFSLNLMMAAILNSAILDSAILIFSLKLTHTCQDWFPPFAQKNLHSFILTQLDDGSHLEFCQLGFRHCHLGFRHLVIFSQIHSKTLSLHSDSDSN